MIRSTPSTARFSFPRMGRLGAGVDPISTGIGLAVSGIGMWMNSIQLSHDADTATTLIVNGLAQQLGNLVSAYLAEPSPTCQDQRAALNAYDEAWAWLQSPQACGAPAYGAAGNRCISDRAPGGKTPWVNYYRDPIANDPRVAALGCDTGQDVILPTVTTGSYGDTGITSTGGSSTTGQTAAQIAAAAVAAAAATGNTASPNIQPVSGAQLNVAAAAPAASFLTNLSPLEIGIGVLGLYLIAKAL